MNTTTLFAELLVIGCGSVLWVALLLLAVARGEVPPAAALPIGAAAALLLPLTYLLGVVTDRVADLLIGPLWKAREEPADYHSLRAEVMCAPENVSRSVEYLRSRIRICRGWCLNAPLCAMGLAAFLTSAPASPGLRRIVIASIPLFLLLAAACWISGKSLVRTEVLRVRDLAGCVRRERE